jgi:hypothetical protein
VARQLDGLLGVDGLLGALFSLLLVTSASTGWDKREGLLPNPGVQYPELDQLAAFACTNRICSERIISSRKDSPKPSPHDGGEQREYGPMRQPELAACGHL